jgi:GT2 family glycosyltransferase
MVEILPISVVLATRDRMVSLNRTLLSLASQNVFPAELIIVDGSIDNRSAEVIRYFQGTFGLACKVRWEPAAQLGAAAQRNQGVAAATQPFIWFFDDDVLFEPDCLARLWRAIQSDKRLGGVNAMITNQQYTNPGLVTHTVYRLLDGNNRASYAGRCIGPAFNILPEDSESLLGVVPVDWLNTTCTIYRREALPNPPFDSHFTGYSFMEDVALSLRVGKQWKLANARTARIYHDSQPATYKDSLLRLAKMELINRHFVMTKILRRNTLSDYLKLALLEAFQIASPLVRLHSWKSLPSVLAGKLAALAFIMGGPRAADSGLTENREQIASS